ncbi:hypothetical protein BU16DRAFT_568462 [Lophium mytilinum]|uniref:Uncharacterized protein n=1 Tax=Lophium mytilinum TaxID=390894 RepID=A0A6A6Q7E0_9PEZI|nr:hypothetical protein BU16DRAFT_568462 [Lophium mytilinum]
MGEDAPLFGGLRSPWPVISVVLQTGSTAGCSTAGTDGGDYLTAPPSDIARRAWGVDAESGLFSHGQKDVIETGDSWAKMHPSSEACGAHERQVIMHERRCTPLRRSAEYMPEYSPCLYSNQTWARTHPPRSPFRGPPWRHAELRSAYHQRANLL